MQLKSNEIERYLNNPNQYHPVILIYGTDQGVVSERVRGATALLLEDNNDPFSKVSLDSDDIASDPGRLADEAGTLALFGAKRVIRVKLNGSRPITKSVQAILDEPPQDATVIIEAGNLAKGQALRKLCEKSKTAAVIPCYPDDIRTLHTLINEVLSRYDIKISPDGKSLLASLLGENRQISRNEIQKICLYAHEKGELNLTDIEKLVGDTSTSIVNDTVDQIMSGEVRAGLTNFQQSLLMNQAFFQTADALRRHLDTLQLFRIQFDRGQSIRQIIDTTKPVIHFKRKQSIANQIQIWSSEDIIKAQDYLLNAIAQTRTKPTLSNTIIHELLVKLSSVAKRNKRHIR